MRRAMVKDIAIMSKLPPSTIRRWADKGIINSKRDFRNWRFFPNPSETVERIEGLLNGEIRLEGET